MTEATSHPPPDQLTDSDANAVVKKVSLRIVPFVFIGSVVAYLDRVNIGYAQLGMGKELGITAAAYGLATAIFFISYFFCEVPSNVLLARFGARKWFARIMVTWGLVTVLTGFVQNVEQLYMARFLLGICEAGFFPGLILYVSRWYRTHDRAKPLSWQVLGQPVAAIVGGLLAGFILDNVFWFGQSSWRWVFILTGVPAAIFGILILFLIPERPSEVSWLEAAELRWLINEVGTDGVTGTSGHGLRAQLAALRDRRAIYLGITLFMFAAGFYGFTLFTPLIIKQINPGYSATNIGVAAVVPYLCGIVGLLLLPRLGTTPRRLRVMATVLAAFGTIGVLAVILLRGSPSLALAGLSLAALASFPFISVFWALVTHAMETAHAAVAFAAINSMSALAGFVGPYLVGQRSTGNTVTSGLFVPVIAFFLCAVLVAFAPITPPTPTHPVPEVGELSAT